MKKTYCDNCGKVLGINDYECKQIETIRSITTLDICKECHAKLALEMEEIVEKYRNGGGNNEA